MGEDDDDARAKNFPENFLMIQRKAGLRVLRYPLPALANQPWPKTEEKEKKKGCRSGKRKPGGPRAEK